MYKHVKMEDLYRISGEILPQLVIDSKLEELGGGGWEGIGFKVSILKKLGYDVDKETPANQIISTYNRIADALNSLGSAVTADKLCRALGI